MQDMTEEEKDEFNAFITDFLKQMDLPDEVKQVVLKWFFIDIEFRGELVRAIVAHTNKLT